MFKFVLEVELFFKSETRSTWPFNYVISVKGAISEFRVNDLKLHFIAKSVWKPDHHAHMLAFPKLLPQSWKHTIVQNVFVCC